MVLHTERYLLYAIFQYKNIKGKLLRNQPSYHLFTNTTYALKGLQDLIYTERSFQIELVLSLFLLPLIFFIESTLIYKLLLFFSLMGVLIAETINSAIERVVDLVTLQHHPMAKRAKDVGSTIVFLSIILFIITWGTIFYTSYFL